MITGYDFITGEVEGFSTLFVVPSLPEDAPAHIREGIARRRIATISGTCPCGAVRPRLSRQRRRAAQRGKFDISHAGVEHDTACPAVAEATLTYLAGTQPPPRPC